MPAKKNEDRSLKALEATAELFARKPQASSAEFREVAESADPAIKGLPGRRFNAKYVLPLKRSAASVKGRGKAAARTAAARVTSGAAERKAGRSGSRSRKGRPARSRGPASSTHETVLRLVLKRDQEVMAAASDATRAYEMAAGVDGFVQRLLDMIG